MRHLVSDLARLRVSRRFRAEQSQLVIATRTVVEDIIRYVPHLITQFVSSEDPTTSSSTELLSLLSDEHRTSLPWTRVSSAQLQSITGLVSPDGIAACLRWPETVAPWPARSTISSTPLERTLVLDGIQDPSNLGLLIRTAFALGWPRILLTSGCVDVFNDKTIRVSKASLFRMPEIVTQVPDDSLGQVLSVLHETRGEQQQTAKPICALTSADPREAASAAVPSAGENQQAPRVLILGSESHGVSQAARRSLEQTQSLDLHHFHLPTLMSLNVAMAGAIIMDRMGRGDQQQSSRCF